MVLPLFTIFPASALQVSILEINPLSFNRVKQTIFNLEFNNYIKAFENVDATKYQVDEPCSFDMVLSETMLRALAKKH